MANIEAEYKKCAKDFFYFCDKYVKIRHSTRGIIPFKLYDYQKRCIEDFENHRFNIVLKFRQGGLSTLATTWSTWKGMFDLKKNQIMFVSKSDREAAKAGQMVDTLLENLPPWLKPSTKGNSVHDKWFPESGGCVSFYTVVAVRSRSPSFLIIDEAAHIRDMDEHWSALYPSLSTGGQCIVISTAHGRANWYAEEYQKAEKGEGVFHRIKINYTEHPEYNDPKWVLEQRAALGDKKFAQEILGEFESSGDTYIPGKVIIDLDLKTQSTPPIKKAFPNWDCSKDEKKGALWIWKAPVPGRDYIIGADTGEGVGEDGDYSAFQVIDTVDNEQVAEFYSNTIPPNTYAQILFQVGRSYNEALVVIEKTGVGVSVVEDLEKQLLYRNLYYKRAGTRFRAGFDTTPAVRHAVCEGIQATLLNKTTKINSNRFVNELYSWVFNKTRRRPEAEKRKHDDLIMSMGIVLRVKSEMYVEVTHAVTTGEIEIDYTASMNMREIIKKELSEIVGDSANEDSIPWLDPIKTSSDIENIAKFNFENRKDNSLLREFGW